MAINVSFGGATIYKPGSYSQTHVDVGSGFPIGPAGLVAVIGEADAGAPGSAEPMLFNNGFSADQLPAISAKYRTGPIVDATNFLFAPASDAAIANGAQTIWIYKTNASVQASLGLSQGGATGYGTVLAQEYGIGGNRVFFGSILTQEAPITVTGSPVSWAGGVTGAVDVYVNGVKFPVSVAGAVSATAAAVTFNAALSTTSVTAGVSGTALTFTQAASATGHMRGWARSFEIAGAGMSVLGLTGGINRLANEASLALTIQQKRDLLTETGTVGGDVLIAIGYSGAAATVTVNSTSIILAAGTTTTLPLNAYVTVKDLADDISARAGWSAVITDSSFYSASPFAIDEVAAVGASSPSGKPALIKQDALEFADFFSTSVIGSWTAIAVTGLPDAVSTTPLAGGARGASSMSDIVNALSQFTKFHVNFILPLFSRDATLDYADGLTDQASTYTIAGIHQAVKTHISLMKTVKKRQERQGYLSIKSTFAIAKTTAANLADGRQQLVIQDVKQADSQGTIKWFQPYALAALLCGARCGASIGEPMTFKYLNTSGIRQTGQAMSTTEANIVQDFDANTQYDEAIQNGITFLEQAINGGYRIVVDNTTYGRDANFVWNRANVIYAADTIALNLRQGLEDVYVGKKNTVSVAEISATAASILDQLRSQGLTVQTGDAPAGYKNLTVSMVGNTIYVSVIVKIVEGIDFVLSDITIQRATA